MECGEPETESDEVLKVATPDPFKVPVPSVAAPSLKVTVPVGVPEPGATAATVAMNVTDWLNTEGFADEVSAVVVLPWFTVWVKTLEVLPLKLLSLP